MVELSFLCIYGLIVCFSLGFNLLSSCKCPQLSCSSYLPHMSIICTMVAAVISCTYLFLIPAVVTGGAMLTKITVGPDEHLILISKELFFIPLLGYFSRLKIYPLHEINFLLFIFIRSTTMNFIQFCHLVISICIDHTNDLVPEYKSYRILADVNECLINVGLCVNGRCRNTEGSFVCECADGYTLTPDGEQCRDINECSEVSI